MAFLLIILTLLLKPLNVSNISSEQVFLDIFLQISTNAFLRSIHDLWRLLYFKSYCAFMSLCEMY